jgi:electron transfer flavoprotein-quinone oxidoreductase
MNSSNYDVIVVGAGSAGLTAAIGLARAGMSVLVLEGADYPGAENWSGCVYFCENLAHPGILGPEAVASLAWERRLIERGFFACDGQGLLGVKYRDPSAFRHCYTVLRPVFDHHLAQVATRLGIAVLARTTAESLIRDSGKVIGVSTNRGAIYADLVFLAEGDASHLVSREGYERYTDQRGAPKFLQGLKQIVELPAGAIEEIFGVDADEGIAYELLVRNGTLCGKPVHLNAGGFVYTNRQSLSIGLVLPIDNLKENFEGDPHLLMEWFANLPALRPWLRQGKPGLFGAKIIRGGGARDIPTLTDDGLAIGGAASGIGIDFPYPNFTGPATAMGLLIAQAAARIRAEGTGFSREALNRHYLEPLRRTHYFQDVEFLRDWPAYVKRTHVFFDRNLDLALGSAYVWTRPRRWFLTKWLNWLRLILQVAGPSQWRDFRSDARALGRALQLRKVMSRPRLTRLILDGTINALRDLAGSPRANLPEAGSFSLHYSVAEEEGKAALPPALFRRWFRRMAGVLASATRGVYSNDNLPLSSKLPKAVELLLRQVNLLDILGFAVLALLATINGLVLASWSAFIGLFTGGRKRTPRGLYPRYFESTQRSTDLTPATLGAAQAWDARLGMLSYDTVKSSHIHLLWPKSLTNKNGIADKGLWHVCPAHVYEARLNSLGELQLVVNHENCIKCETCWRASDLVDWGRDGRQRFCYPVASPAALRLVETAHAPGIQRINPPRLVDAWQPSLEKLKGRLYDQKNSFLVDFSELADLPDLVEKLDRKLTEFDEAIGREPRHVDRPRAEYLEMLARYSQQLAARIVEILRHGTLADSPNAAVQAIHEELLTLAGALLARTEERARRTWDQRFAWAAADGRQIRHHHVTGLRRLLNVAGQEKTAAGESALARRWLGVYHSTDGLQTSIEQWRKNLDAVFGSTAWREIDRGAELNSAQDALLRELLAQIPLLNTDRLPQTLHPPVRSAILSELGRKDPSLAYRAASHLWARDLASLRPTAPELSELAERLARGDQWGCFAEVDAARSPEGGWHGEAWYVPSRYARTMILLVPNYLGAADIGSPGLRLETIGTLGLRGAGICRIYLDGLQLSGTTVDQEQLRRVWHALSAADLTAIARGMAEQLCLRAVEHANTRVQFPGLFHDEESRDTIGKFGAVKKMLAEMAARRLLVETLDAVLAPTDFSAASVERASLVKALAAEALGSSPGSVSYNAGQIFGGTGYSEDDILSKYYRDASALRFLGPVNHDVFRRHGEQLLHNWSVDGRRLAALENEAELFDQVVQRKALQGELDEVRVLRSRLRNLINEWLQSLKEPVDSRKAVASASPLFAAEIIEGVGRHDAVLLAAKVLLLHLHARLENGLDSETECALFRVWLDDAAWQLETFENQIHQGLSRRIPGERPLTDPSAAPGPRIYADFLTGDCRYTSGDFLLDPIDVSRPRMVPEMVESDPDLAARETKLRQLLAKQFAGGRPGGLSYERYLEKRHRPDEEDLDFCRRQGFFRMTIPARLGGEGKQKIDYYFLTMNAQRLSDVGISLLIQVNSSIGTTPITLALEGDLPKACEDLGKFLENYAIQRDVRSRLTRMLRLIETASPKRVDEALSQLRQRAEEVLSKAALRTLAFRFSAAWQEARAARAEFDSARFTACLNQAMSAWQDVCTMAPQMREELARRQEALELCLRWIAAGQISGFALTEPSAGSDTARVATRACLQSVPVDVEVDGVLHFIPKGGRESRYLLDARRLVFQPDGVYYRWSEQADPAQIHFDEYDYETDDPARMRYYDHGQRRVHFTDIAQLRDRDGRQWYDYWELTGAKMWITNGRMAGLFCLYAKTDEGITGFVVDRHAEGLAVGKDEAKMGQLGSPTNELSLQRVRVPRENVLGLEGRGQVNALDALNVGRAGLSTSAVAQMPGIIEHARAFLQASCSEPADWALQRLERMEQIRFTTEALAYEMIGRLDHPQTRGVRMESAIAKMLTSELLQELIELAEDLYSVQGQTQAHLLEKRKRDARILNIYEGTNEVQRFLILKDLVTDVAPRRARKPESPLPSYLGPEAVELEALRGEIWKRITAAGELFGNELWRNPNLQANCFLLAEIIAWFKAAESTLSRIAWLSHNSAADEGDNVLPGVAIGRGALDRCLGEANYRLRRFDEELAHLRRGHYGFNVRAASLVLRSAPTKSLQRLPSCIASPLSVLVIVSPTLATTPQPQVAGGKLLEAHFSLSDADKTALETALRLRDDAVASVNIEVAAVGPRTYASALREGLYVGVERVRLVLTDTDGTTPDSAARALAAVLQEEHFDLVLGGLSGSDEEGLVAVLTGELLGIPFAGSACQLKVQKDAANCSLLLLGQQPDEAHARSLPATVSVEAGISLRGFTMSGFLDGQARAVEMERWPKIVEPCLIRFMAPDEASTGTVSEAPQSLTAPQAAEFLMKELQLVSGDTGDGQLFSGNMSRLEEPSLVADSILAVLAATGEGQLSSAAGMVLRAARQLSSAEDLPIDVMIMVPGGEIAQRRAAAQVLQQVNGNIILVECQRALADARIMGMVLRQTLPGLGTKHRAVLGEPWCEDAFAALGRIGCQDRMALRVSRLGRGSGESYLETRRAGGKLRIQRPFRTDRNTTWWIVPLGEALIIDGTPQVMQRPVQVFRWSPSLDSLYQQPLVQQFLQEAKQTSEIRLANAEIILDVGFGVRNRDGYEAVVLPLEHALRSLGIRNLAVGGSRKVTEELLLLPADKQIGQSGVTVNPRILIAIGISGAPQHINYLGTRCTILAFNRDPEAPIMVLNRRQAHPRVIPVVGDLFETIPAFTAALKHDTGHTTPSFPEAPTPSDRLPQVSAAV